MNADAPVTLKEVALKEVTVEEYDTQRAAEVEQRREDYLALLRRMRAQRGKDNGHDGPRIPPYTPFLLIRHALGDIGARPVAPGVPFWVSPDIWVRSSDPLGNPVAGEANTLVARVFNLGAFQAVPVEVRFAWADPSLGLTPSSMNHIGSAWVDVPSLSSVEVECPVPWVPVMVNSGHECVMVSCSNWIADPVVSPFDPVTDRHVAQRNLHVVGASSAPATELLLTMANPFPFDVVTTVEGEARRLRLRTDARGADLARTAIAAAVADELEPKALRRHYARGSLGRTILDAAGRRRRRHPDLADRGPEVEEVPGEWSSLLGAAATGEPTRQRHPADRRHAAALLHGGGENERRASARVLTEAPLPGSSRDTVRTRVRHPDDLAEDEVVVVDLTQRIGDIVVGGYTVVVVPG